MWVSFYFGNYFLVAVGGLRRVNFFPSYFPVIKITLLIHCSNSKAVLKITKLTTLTFQINLFLRSVTRSVYTLLSPSLETSWWLWPSCLLDQSPSSNLFQLPPDWSKPRPPACHLATQWSWSQHLDELSRPPSGMGLKMTSTPTCLYQVKSYSGWRGLTATI